MQLGTAAVVVTFHPDEDVTQNLQALAAETGNIIVVDNGSSSAELTAIETMADAGGVTLIKIGWNAGLGAALNVGLREARLRGAVCACLFDQDSRVAPGFIATISAFVAEAGAAIVVPRYIDRATNEEIPLLRVGQGPIEAIMTSGMTLSLAAIEEIGLFNESFFIDCTDYEFSTRARKSGYRLLQCSTATLFHAPAKRKNAFIFGRKICTVSHYSPQRRYYIARNSVYIIEMSKEFPSLRRIFMRATVAETVKAMLFERHRFRSARMILLGVKDALRHVTGYTVTL